MLANNVGVNIVDLCSRTSRYTHGGVMLRDSQYFPHQQEGTAEKFLWPSVEAQRSAAH